MTKNALRRHPKNPDDKYDLGKIDYINSDLLTDNQKIALFKDMMAVELLDQPRSVLQIYSKLVSSKASFSLGLYPVELLKILADSMSKNAYNKGSAFIETELHLEIQEFCNLREIEYIPDQHKSIVQKKYVEPYESKLNDLTADVVNVKRPKPSSSDNPKESKHGNIKKHKKIFNPDDWEEVGDPLLIPSVETKLTIVRNGITQEAQEEHDAKLARKMQLEWNAHEQKAQPVTPYVPPHPISGGPMARVPLTRKYSGEYDDGTRLGSFVGPDLMMQHLIPSSVGGKSVLSHYPSNTNNNLEVLQPVDPQLAEAIRLSLQSHKPHQPVLHIEIPDNDTKGQEFTNQEQDDLEAAIAMSLGLNPQNIENENAKLDRGLGSAKRAAGSPSVKALSSSGNNNSTVSEAPPSPTGSNEATNGDSDSPPNTPISGDLFEQNFF